MPVTLDPDAQKVLDAAKLLNLPPFETLTPEQARARVSAMREALKQAVPQVAEVRDLKAEGPHGPIPMRLYRNKTAAQELSQPCLVYYHGGGWLFGDLDSHDILCRNLARMADCTVIAVDYRLAPEHKFPKAFDDAYGALTWIAGHARELSLDRARMAVGGDSAGGNLATTVALQARDHNFDPPLTYQLLVYPAVDMGFKFDSYSRVGDGYMLTTAGMVWFRGHYLTKPEDEDDWRASPLRAKDSSKLPPAFVITAAADPLCDEGAEYVRALEKHGVKVTHSHYDGQMHAFIGLSGIIKAADDAVAEMGAALKKAWGKELIMPDVAKPLSVPFDHAKLDRLLDDAGIDVLIATSKHSIQYLLGGHRAFFFDYMDAFGTSRYLPVFVYAKGKLDKTLYVGHGLEGHQLKAHPVWTPEVQVNGATSITAMERGIEHIRKLGLNPRRIGVETAFLPMDVAAVLRKAFPDADIADALFPLERLRAVKSPEELAKLKLASERVVESMLTAMAKIKPGVTKDQVTQWLREEEVKRELIFEYCLITAGTSLNRAPSEQVIQEGDILSIDFGGNYHGYIGDLCRMAILGEPDAELQDLLAEIDEIQRIGMKPIKQGTIGREIYDVAEERLKKSKQHNHIDFLAHGMGLVTHEAPRLTATGPVKYEAYDADKPLQAGMVVSVETTLNHPQRGFIKLEDTVVVTPTGYEMYGDAGRGWNRAGTAVK